MKRNIITIDEDQCNGCGLCIPNCPEGAIQMIDGKARLISDLFCDGLGACLGQCPEGAITLEEREAEPYEEKMVMANIVKLGPNVIKAHLLHLKDHGENDLLRQAVKFLKDQGIENPLLTETIATMGDGKPRDVASSCPGSRSMTFEPPSQKGGEDGPRPSQLKHWPVQMHLASPRAPHYQGADVLLAADCVAHALGDFHKEWLKGKALMIACPKLDSNKEVYHEKIKALIDDAKINTLTIMMMDVPCCSGLLALAKRAAAEARRKTPIKAVVVGIQGNILKQKWI